MLFLLVSTPVEESIALRTQLLIDKVSTWMDSDNKSLVFLFKNANVKNIGEFKKCMSTIKFKIYQL